MQTVIVAAGVLIEGGRVLLTQRKEGGHLAGMWEFPGGKVEAGEDPRHALRRELREELGIETVVGEILDVAFHRYDGTSAASPQRGPHQGEGKPVLLLFFEAGRTAESPEPRALDVAALEWATADGLRVDRFPPADVAVLEKVKARLG